MSPASNGLTKHSLVSIRLINRTTSTEPSYSSGLSPHLDLSQLTLPTLTTPSLSPNEANFSVPYSSSSPVESQAINVTSRPDWWLSTIYNHPDVMLAFALIIFYAIFVLFICVIIIRIVLTIVMTGSSFKLASGSDGYSDGIDAETSSRTRGISQSQSKSRRYYQQEMTSFAIDRTNSPSIIDEEEEEES